MHSLEAGTNIKYIRVLLGHKQRKYTHMLKTKSIQKNKPPFDDLEI